MAQGAQNQCGPCSRGTDKVKGHICVTNNFDSEKREFICAFCEDRVACPLAKRYAKVEAAAAAPAVQHKPGAAVKLAPPAPGATTTHAAAATDTPKGFPTHCACGCGGTLKPGSRWIYIRGHKPKRSISNVGSDAPPVISESRVKNGVKTATFSYMDAPPKPGAGRLRSSAAAPSLVESRFATEVLTLEEFNARYLTDGRSLPAETQQLLEQIDVLKLNTVLMVTPKINGQSLKALRERIARSIQRYRAKKYKCSVRQLTKHKMLSVIKTEVLKAAK
jgi:hypothetical protein